jgi:hypothetical protein
MPFYKINPSANFSFINIGKTEIHSIPKASANLGLALVITFAAIYCKHNFTKVHK